MTGEEARKILRKLLAEDDDLDFFSYEEKKAIDHFAYKGEWIPTIERVPEVGDTVLCSVKTPECTNHHIIICKYCAEEFWKDGTIRAWQPLPEPYKAESEEE